MTTYKVVSALDRKQRPLGTLTVEGDKPVSYEAEGGKQSGLFASSIDKGETMRQLMGHYTNFVFIPEGESNA